MATSGAAAAAFTIVPRHVLGGAGFVAPSEKITLAHIGCGTQGLRELPGLLSIPAIQVVAVCDPVKEGHNYVDWSRDGLRSEIASFLGKSNWRRESAGIPGGREVAKDVIETYYADTKKTDKYSGCRAYADFRELLEKEKLPAELMGKDIWKHRFEEINNFEQYLVGNGIVVLKFFLNISKEEQKRRLLARIERPEKNWKFSVTDPVERAYWDDYTECYEDALNHTSTEHAPWYIIPADHKWFSHVVVADVIVEKLKSLKLKYPVLSKKERQHLLEAKALLENELSKKK